MNNRKIFRRENKENVPGTKDFNENLNSTAIHPIRPQRITRTPSKNTNLPFHTGPTEA
jgi:hypothetical protein